MTLITALKLCLPFKISSMLANCECTKLQYSSCKDIWRSYISSFSNFNANTFKHIIVDYFSANLEKKVYGSHLVCIDFQEQKFDTQKIRQRLMYLVWQIGYIGLPLMKSYSNNKKQQQPTYSNRMINVAPIWPQNTIVAF